MINTCGCGLDFSFNKKKYEGKGWGDPSRCPRCRDISKYVAVTNKADLQTNVDYSDVPTIEPGIIQSGKFVLDAVKDRTMFNGIIRFNHMHYPERVYCYDTIVAAYINIHASINNYTMVNTFIRNANGVYLYAICRKNHEKKVKKLLSYIADPYVYINDDITFNNHFIAETKESINDNFWMDLNNKFIFCFGEERAIRLYSILRNIDLVESEVDKALMTSTLTTLRSIKENNYNTEGLIDCPLDIDVDTLSEKVLDELSLRTGLWER